MVKMVLVVEVHDAETDDEAMEQLDDFRETVLPSDYGLSIYRATYPDLEEFVLKNPTTYRNEFVQAVIDD